MDWNEIVTYIDRVLNTVLFTLARQPVTLVTLLVFLLILLLTFWAARLFEHAVERAFRLRGVGDPGLTGSVGRLVRYVILVIGFALALQNVGFDLGALFAAGAIFAVALGFALQGSCRTSSRASCCSGSAPSRTATCSKSSPASCA